MSPAFNSLLGFIVAFLLLTVPLTGCPAPGSKVYKGFSPVEQGHLSNARRDVFPNDVRENLERYRMTKVAWPGFIRDARWMEKDGGFQTTFVLEHHYYDWIVDYSIQKEKLFISPRGEGNFSTVCPAQKEQEEQTLTATGNLLIVYGTPEKDEDGMPYLTCDYARFIKKEWIRTDVMDYGRPNEPVRFINIPGPSSGTTLGNAGSP